MTVAEALRDAAARLEAAGVPSPRLDAELLLRHVLGWDAARLIACPQAAVPESGAAEYAALITQRATRRPLQHLTGSRAFWKHEFAVSPDVLIPRPETELLVEATVELLAGAARPLIVDVGTGSGCIAVSIALERPDAEVWAVDVSPAALRVAEDNARRLGARVHFARSDLLGGVPHLAGRVDLVVSNPPYVDPAEIPGLEPEVRDHEPRHALHAAEGREALYERLAREASTVLRPEGVLAVEIGAGMAEDVNEILVAEGLAVTRVIADLQGIARVILSAQRR